MERKEALFMIKNWFITGDTHGAELLCRRLRYFKIRHAGLVPEETGIIILGDAGINYHGETLGGSYDAGDKKAVNKFGYQLYLLRGNHEFRPSTLPNIKYAYDENVEGHIYYEEAYQNIHYFKDGGDVYLINDFPIYVIPGAYSVDKNFRLATGKKWFRDEQLTEEEKERLLDLLITCNEFDEEPAIVLSHTCPLCWEEYINYLFMDGLDQASVDKTTEKFLDKVYAKIWYKRWYFGHYHDDRDFPDINATILFKQIIPFGSTLEESV